MDRLICERRVWDSGSSRVAGVDEVGRGAWAGPMVAAAVVLYSGFDTEGIRDCKQMKPEGRRRACDRILNDPKCSVAVKEVSAAEIDDRGIEPCHVELMRDVVLALSPPPDYGLIDYYRLPELTLPHEGVPGGDDVSASIAAASIIAKVTRDDLIMAFGLEYPGYGFEKNKGYGAPQHCDALRELGASPIHRLSSKGVRRSLYDEEQQRPSRDLAWRRFVWMPGEITVTRPNGEAVEGGLADSPDAQTVRASEVDELMDEIDRIIRGER